MALNNSAADAAAAAIASALVALSAEAKQNPTEIWKVVMRQIYARLATDAVVTATIPASSIITAGSATTQTGPAAPVSISGTVG